MVDSNIRNDKASCHDVYLYQIEIEMRLFNQTKLLFALIIFLWSCKEDQPRELISTKTYSADVAYKWMELTREMVKFTPGFTPPVSARAFGYLGITLYESVVPGMGDHVSLTNQLNDFKTGPQVDLYHVYDWRLSANSASASILRQLFSTAPANILSKIDSLETSIQSEIYPALDAEIISRSENFGKAVANHVHEYSTTDGGDQGQTRNFPANYIVPNGVGFWTPTSSQLIPLQPYWGENRAFTSVKNLVPTTKVPYSEVVGSAFYAQALEVYSAVNSLSAEGKEVALYWSDDPGIAGTPAGHSISIASQVIKREKLNLAKAVRLYAQMGIALNDAFISCWKCKYTYNLLRPVSYINKLIDPIWKTVLNTPPFPEFTSGHSVQTAAAAVVLENAVGSSYNFVDSTHAQRVDIGRPVRSYNSFNEMAFEAALSRLYGGIHFREAIEVGINQGRAIGGGAIRLRWLK